MDDLTARSDNALSRADVAAIRRDLYAYLAGLLVEAPEEAALHALLDEATASLLDGFNEDGLVDDMRGAARSTPFAGLRQDYWDLFVVPGGKFVTPFQSVYLDEREIAGEKVRDLTMGDSAIGVMRAYREAGFEHDTSRHPLHPDHVAVELSFMARLCERERAAWDAGKTDEALATRGAAFRFVDGNLVQWLPALAARVKERADGRFYPALVSLASRFAEADRADLRCDREVARA